MGGVLLKEKLKKLTSDALTLATRPNPNSHQVGALWHLNVMLLLQLTLLLDVLLARLLHKEGCVADNSLSVLLASHDNLVDVRLPKRLDHHARVTVLVERVPVDLAECAEISWLVLLCLLNDTDLNFLSLRDE